MSFLQTIFKPIANLGRFWQQSFNSVFFRWNLIFVFIQLIVLIWQFGNLPQQVPLYYSLPWGESQLVSASTLFLIPTLSIVLFFVNHLFAIGYSEKNPLLSKLLILNSLLVSFFFLFTLLKIIYLVV
ncbi:MAG: hypothetical protein PHX84_00515 [Candidatus Shapirobacteria bacterium]|jgi:hypothetical protein|nr:hypothetical protein [Candidatus Shapirobacteria bacterium]